MDTDTIFLFPPFRLDVRNEQLWRDGQSLTLRPKTFAVLRVLVAQAGQLVTQDALLDAVWGPMAVSEAVVRRSIRELRTALGDTAQQPQFIQTVHRRGYRFIAPVTVASLPQPLRPPATEAPREASPSILPAPEAPVPPAAEPLLDEEHKVVTVLCCTVPEAPALAVQRGPEAMHRLMQAVFAVLQAVMQRYTGTLMHVTGEGCTGVFGAPVGQEDHARRAVLAALDLLQELHAHPLGQAHTPGIGLHTGPMVVGSMTSMPQQLYTAVGDTLHQAGQLQRLAPPGTILMSAVTHRLVQTEVQSTIWDPAACDGQGMSGPVYMVQSLTQRRAGVMGQGMRHRSHFAGRARELAVLHECLAHVTQGDGQAVDLVGEPGIGKSRLLAEFRRSLAGQPVTYREGHCLPYSTTTPYLPVRDLLRQGGGITEADGPVVITASIRRSLEEAHLTPEDNAPFLLQLLDMPVDGAWLTRFSPQERKSRTFALLRHLMLHDSQRQPLVLAVENLHWIDATSEEWLTTFVAHLAGMAILLLITHRPGYQPPWVAQPVVTQIALPRLLPEDSRAVVQSVLPTPPLPAPLLETIVTTAAGNPFFLEELAWTVREQSPQMALPGIPDTIQAVLAARIDRLPPAEKRLLQIAAVIGTTVAMPLLQAIAELPVETVQQGLVHLQAAEFLYETHLLPERVYTFKHALTHDVAYRSLLHERQRVLHTRIVEVLEVLYPAHMTEQIERLAHHALCGEVWDKAVVCCQQAGARAFDRAAFREAVTYFEQALQALAHLHEHGDTRVLAIELRLALGRALTQMGRYGRHLTLLGEAEALARALDDRARLGRVLAQMTSVLWITGDHDGAMAAGPQALALAAELSDSTLQVQASFNLGQAYYITGDFGQAAELLRWIMGATDKESGTPGTDWRIRSQAWLARTLSALGAFAEGQHHGEEALRLATREGRGSASATAHACLGLLYLAKGDLEHASRVFDQGLALCRASGSQDWLRVIVAGLGYAYALQGRLAEGHALLEEAIRLHISTGALGLHSVWVVWLSEVCRLAGRGDEAWQYARQAFDLARQLKERGHEAHALLQLGTVHAHVAPPDATQAEVHYRQARILAEELGMRPLLAHCYLGLGTLYLQTDQQEQARAELSTAIALYRVMGMNFWLPQAEEVLGQVEG